MTPAQAPRQFGWLWPLLILAILGALGLAGYLIDELSEGAAFRFDAMLLLALRRPGDFAVPIGPTWLLQSAIDISALGGFTLLWLLGCASIAFLAYLRRRADAACLAASLIGASVLNFGLKSLFHRSRPDIVPHLASVANSSFPSGHAMVSAAIYLTIGVTLAQAQPRHSARAVVVGFFVVLVLLIGASRVYLGVHWPSDVLAGWSLGSVWALLIFAAERLIQARTRRSAGA